MKARALEPVRLELLLNADLLGGCAACACATNVAVHTRRKTFARVAMKLDYAKGAKVDDRSRTSRFA
jgi:hypothetical protein